MSESKFTAEARNNQAKNAVAKNAMDEAVQKCIEKITQHLSQPIEESALTYGALIRRRVIKSARDLLMALMMYAMCGMSQRKLAVVSAVMGLGDMTDQAWQKKLYYAYPG